MTKLILAAALVANAMGAVLNTVTTPVITTTTPAASAATTTPAGNASADWWCTAGTGTSDSVQGILDTTGPVFQLDTWIKTGAGSENDWVNTLWSQIFPGGSESPMSGCGQINGQCDNSTRCSAFPNTTMYWMFQSVQSLHDKINAAHSTLIGQDWISSSTIDQIGSDFAVPVPNNSWPGYAANAFKMSSTQDSVVSDLSSLVLDMFEAVSANTTIVDTASAFNTLSKIAGAVADRSAQLLSDATGNGDANTLTIDTPASIMQYATTKFYYQTGILLDEKTDESKFSKDFSNFVTNLEKKIVTLAMSSAYYILLDDTTITSESNCTGKGALWLTAGASQRCFSLTKPSSTDGCTINDPTGCSLEAWQPPLANNSNAFDTTIYDKLTDTYGIDLTTLYNSAIDCALFGNGAVDEGTKVGGVPRCFYDIWVGSSSWVKQTSYTDLRMLAGLFKLKG